jgi:hypothetical protein
MHKWPHSDKLYQSVSTSIQLKPTFLRKKTLSNTAQFCTLYAEQLLRAETNAQPCPRFLGRHEIDVQLRAKMLDWMVEVTSSYRFANKTYFDGVQIMDRYFEAEPEALPPARLHLIGVQCMLIASKMNEVFPLKTRTVFEKIGHRKLPLEDLLAMEERIMKRLDYHLNSWTFFDLAMLKLAEYHAYEEARRDAMGRLAGDEGTPEDRLKRLEELCAFICKHLVFEYDFLCENSMTAVAEACVKGVLEISGANSQPVCFFSSSPITLELAKQKVFKIMRRFKGNFNALGNIFRFTPEEVLTQVAEFSWN